MKIWEWTLEWSGIVLFETINGQLLGQQRAVTKKASGIYLEEHIHLGMREKRNYRRSNLEKQEESFMESRRHL